MPQISRPGLHRRLVEFGVPIPTILITAYPEENVLARALEAGVIGYLTKPFNTEDLVTCVRSALDLG